MRNEQQSRLPLADFSQRALEEVVLLDVITRMAFAE
jgi:hypothetical protein